MRNELQICEIKDKLFIFSEMHKYLIINKYIDQFFATGIIHKLIHSCFNRMWKLDTVLGVGN